MLLIGNGTFSLRRGVAHPIYPFANNNSTRPPIPSISFDGIVKVKGVASTCPLCRDAFVASVWDTATGSLKHRALFAGLPVMVRELRDVYYDAIAQLEHLSGRAASSAGGAAPVEDTTSAGASSCASGAGDTSSSSVSVFRKRAATAAAAAAAAIAERDAAKSEAQEANLRLHESRRQFEVLAAELEGEKAAHKLSKRRVDDLNVRLRAADSGLAELKRLRAAVVIGDYAAGKLDVDQLAAEAERWGAQNAAVGAGSTSSATLSALQHGALKTMQKARNAARAAAEKDRAALAERTAELNALNRESAKSAAAANRAAKERDDAQWRLSLAERAHEHSRARVKQLEELLASRGIDYPPHAAPTHHLNTAAAVAATGSVGAAPPSANAREAAVATNASRSPRRVAAALLGSSAWGDDDKAVVTAGSKPTATQTHHARKPLMVASNTSTLHERKPPAAADVSEVPSARTPAATTSSGRTRFAEILVRANGEMPSDRERKDAKVPSHRPRTARSEKSSGDLRESAMRVVASDSAEQLVLGQRQMPSSSAAAGAFLPSASMRVPHEVELSKPLATLTTPAAAFCDELHVDTTNSSPQPAAPTAGVGGNTTSARKRSRHLALADDSVRPPSQRVTAPNDAEAPALPTAVSYAPTTAGPRPAAEEVDDAECVIVSSDSDDYSRVSEVSRSIVGLRTTSHATNGACGLVPTVPSGPSPLTASHIHITGGLVTGTDWFGGRHTLPSGAPSTRVLGASADREALDRAARRAAPPNSMRPRRSMSDVPSHQVRAPARSITEQLLRPRQEPLVFGAG